MKQSIFIVTAALVVLGMAGTGRTDTHRDVRRAAHQTATAAALSVSPAETPVPGIAADGPAPYPTCDVSLPKGQPPPVTACTIHDSATFPQVITPRRPPTNDAVPNAPASGHPPSSR